MPGLTFGKGTGLVNSTLGWKKTEPKDHLVSGAGRAPSRAITFLSHLCHCSRMPRVPMRILPSGVPRAQPSLIRATTAHLGLGGTWHLSPPPSLPTSAQTILEVSAMPA